LNNFSWVWIVVAAVVIMIALMWMNDIYGYEYKNVTITVAQNSLFYCWFGNPDKGNVVCDSVDMEKRQWKEFDDFIEAFANDRVERSYKVEIP
jgi:hypothetical protein